jgi:hypothetical protein
MEYTTTKQKEKEGKEDSKHLTVDSRQQIADSSQTQQVL